MKGTIFKGLLYGLPLLLAGCYLPKNDVADNRLATINHIVLMGQSLGAGEQSLPIVTDKDTGFGNLKFAIGTHTWSNNNNPAKPWLRSMDDFLFIPLTAQQRGGEGETIANGMCDHLTQTIKDESSKNAHFLFSYSGQGGRYLRELNKRHDDAKDERAGRRQSGGGYYKTSIDDIKRAKTTADSLQLSYAVFAICWMQGEAESGLRVNRWDSVLSRQETIETYKSDLIQVKKDYQNDVKSIIGQSKNVPFFTYQTFGAVAGTAQLMACDQEKEMFMVAPTYMLPNAENGFYFSGDKLLHGDGIHLTADGERWLGEQFGKVMRKVIMEGQEWQPTRPLKSWYNESENRVFIKFHTPTPPLAIDTTFLPKQGDGLGFEVYDESGKVYSIDHVSIAGMDLLEINLADKLSQEGSFFVRYGLKSFVGEISKAIKFINPNSVGRDGHASVEIGFDGDIQNEFSVLCQEGVFYLHNEEEEGQRYTNLIVRETYLDENGDTVLKGEADDLRNKVDFQVGQICFTSRRYNFGNIRDSDNEKSTFTFKDSTYGKRNGKSYPLWNWSIVFQDLAVKAEK